jgi:capsule polysaccharide export protein KpsC/LpsZ
MRSVQEVVAELREAAAGRYVWRVQRKENKAYCIEFSEWEKAEAERWWNQESKRRPEFYEDFELARVHFRTKAENLMLESADLLESLGS